MLYDKEEIYNKAIEIIETEDIIFMHEVISFLPCSKTTFYDLFPSESEESEYIKELLNDNKVKTKIDIREKLKKSNKSAELLALYRLASTPEEHRLLNQTYQETKNEHKGEIKIVREIKTDGS